MTRQQLEAALAVAATLYEIIAAHGPTGIPSGHLYATTMGSFSDLAAYEACLGLLVKGQLVRREGHLLVAAAI